MDWRARITTKANIYNYRFFILNFYPLIKKINKQASLISVKAEVYKRAANVFQRKRAYLARCGASFFLSDFWNGQTCLSSLGGCGGHASIVLYRRLALA